MPRTPEGGRPGCRGDALGYVEDGERPILVQRRFGTGSLAEALRDGRFSVERVLRIARQLAHVLARVHGARVVHRDIKPANILYDAASEQIALGDFGISAELPVNAHALPVGDLIGTPAYASPEHTGRTRTGCDARSDLYSLGVTLYELLTGTRPFPEHQLLELVAAHLSKVPEAPHHRVAEIPAMVSQLVMKLPDGQGARRALSVGARACGGRPRALPRGAGLAGPDRPVRARPIGSAAAAVSGRGCSGAARSSPRSSRRTRRRRRARPRWSCLSGRDGVGPAELVRTLVRETAVDGPFALGGWAAAGGRPLSGLADALGAMAEQLLLLDEDRLVALRRQCAARLGQIGQVVIDIAPALGDVLGPQPALVELAPEATRARLHHAFVSLAGALGESAPLVLALQNIEHADPASLSVIEAILNSPIRCRALIVVMAPEPAAFGRLRDRPGAISIELGGAVGRCDDRVDRGDAWLRRASRDPAGLRAACQIGRQPADVQAAGRAPGRDRGDRAPRWRVHLVDRGGARRAVTADVRRRWHRSGSPSCPPRPAARSPPPWRARIRST